MTATFGSPAPLPGQPGFRARPSEVMARETADMEERLARLKTDLTADSEMRDAAGPRDGGARWRSARADRGSVRAYANDVKVRHEQQLRQRPPHGIFASGRVGVGGHVQPQAGAGARAAAALRGEQQHRHSMQDYGKQEVTPGAVPTGASDQHVSVHCGFGGKEVSRWRVADTLEWLDGLGLGKYRKVFKQNEISGPILLEVGLDDLDYMSVCVLAHRKQILKGIEELRRTSGRPNANKPPPPAPAFLMPKDSNGGVGATDSGSVSGGAVVALARNDDSSQGSDRRSPSNSRKQHWSHVKPLSDVHTTCSDNRRRQSPARLADGHYDEAASQSSFADAVAEWRSQRDPSKLCFSKRDPTMICRAPVAGIPNTEKIITVRGGGALAQGKGKGLLGGSAATECWTNPFSTPGTSKHIAASKEDELVELETDLISPPRLAKAVDVCAGQGVGQAGNFPTLDEDAEHEAFRQAVAEWNRESKPRKTESCGRGDNVSISARADGTSSSAEEAAPRRTAKMMADALREQMDTEHRLQARELEGEKKNLLESLETARRDIKGQGGREGRGEEAHYAGEELSRVGGAAMRSLHKLAHDSSGTKEGRGYDKKQAWEDSKNLEESGVEWDRGERSGSASPAPSRGFISRSSSEGAELLMLGEGKGEEHNHGQRVEIELMESVLGAGMSGAFRGSYLVDEGESSSGDDL